MTKKVRKGYRHPNTQLKEWQIAEMRRKRKEGHTVKSLAAEYGLSIGACSKALSGKTWGHLTERANLPTLYKAEYYVYRAMIQRCTDPKSRSYSEYGGRGIKVCQEWLDSFEAFLASMGPRPSEKHSLDRIDPNGHYEPNNVRWVTVKDQARNKRNTVRIEWPEVSGNYLPAAEVAEALNISYSQLRASLIKEGRWPKNEQQDRF